MLQHSDHWNQAWFTSSTQVFIICNSRAETFWNSMNVLENVNYLGNGFLLAKSEIQASYRISKNLINSPEARTLEVNFGLYNTRTDSMLKVIALEPIRSSEKQGKFKKDRSLSSIPGDSKSVNLMWGSRICNFKWHDFAILSTYNGMVYLIIDGILDLMKYP